MKNSLPVIFLIASLPLLFGAGGQEQDASADTINAFVSILPQAYFLERIGGDRVKVEVMVTPGKSPATYEPTPQQMVKLGSADVFFTIGVPFEAAFLPTLESTLKDLPLIDTSAGIERRMLEAHSHEEEDDQAEGHDDDHKNDHEEYATPDPHVWMNPVNARIIAHNMADFLIDQDADNAAIYQTNLNALVKDLDALHRDLEETLAPLAGETLFVYHPAFGYFADQYGLKQVAIETGGKEPGPAQLEEIIHHAQEEGVRVIFVQPEFAQSSAKAVAGAIGGTVVMAASLEKEYIENLKTISRAIEDGLQ